MNIVRKNPRKYIEEYLRSYGFGCKLVESSFGEYEVFFDNLLVGELSFKKMGRNEFVNRSIVSYDPGNASQVLRALRYSKCLVNLKLAFEENIPLHKFIDEIDECILGDKQDELEKLIREYDNGFRGGVDVQR